MGLGCAQAGAVIRAGLASDHARVKVLSVLVPGRILMNHTGSTVPTIAQDGPSSERGRGKHTNEVFQSSGAGRSSTVKTFGLSSTLRCGTVCAAGHSQQLPCCEPG